MTINYILHFYRLKNFEFLIFSINRFGFSSLKHNTISNEEPLSLVKYCCILFDNVTIVGTCLLVLKKGSSVALTTQVPYRTAGTDELDLCKPEPGSRGRKPLRRICDLIECWGDYFYFTVLFFFSERTRWYFHTVQVHLKRFQPSGYTSNRY